MESIRIGILGLGAIKKRNLSEKNLTGLFKRNRSCGHMI